MLIQSIKEAFHYPAQQASQRNAVSQTTIAQTDRVTLSMEGQLTADFDKHILQFAVGPDWFQDYYPKSLLLSNGALEETAKLHQMYEHAEADGQMTFTGQQAIDQFRKHSMPENQAVRDHYNFRQEHRHALSEYSKIHQQHYAAAKEEMGLNSNNFVEEVISAKNGNLAFRQNFESRLLGDPSAVALMNTLGIDPSPKST